MFTIFKTDIVIGSRSLTQVNLSRMIMTITITREKVRQEKLKPGKNVSTDSRS